MLSIAQWRQILLCCCHVRFSYPVTVANDCLHIRSCADNYCDRHSCCHLCIVSCNITSPISVADVNTSNQLALFSNLICNIYLLKCDFVVSIFAILWSPACGDWQAGSYCLKLLAPVIGLRRFLHWTYMLKFDILCTVVASDWRQYVVGVLYDIAYSLVFVS